LPAISFVGLDEKEEALNWLQEIKFALGIFYK
jgi:hypothetical protein